MEELKAVRMRISANQNTFEGTGAPFVFVYLANVSKVYVYFMTTMRFSNVAHIAPHPLRSIELM